MGWAEGKCDWWAVEPVTVILSENFLMSTSLVSISFLLVWNTSMGLHIRADNTMKVPASSRANFLIDLLRSIRIFPAS